MAVKIQTRRDTATNWSTANPVLADGEVGYDKTNNNFRVGDGVTAWNSLTTTGGGGSGTQDLADVLTQGNDAGAAKIINLDDPDNPQDASTKAYTDATAGTVNTALSAHISDATDAHAATAITNTPAGGIAATTVQAAIYELDTEKAPLASPTFTGNPTAPTPTAGDNDTSIATTAFVNTAVVGVQDLYVPASAMWPRTTGGCSVISQYEMTTSLLNIQALAFDQTTQEFAQFQISLPRKWNNGTVTAIPYWTTQGGTGTVQFGISGGAYSNDDALTVSLGTAQTSDDTLLATNDLHIGPETSAITLAGTPASADFLAFQISRNPASDTLSSDALLLGVVIRITTTAAKDA